MRKLDLVHIHALGIELAQHIAREEGCTVDDLFEEYADVDISGPHDVRAQKATQKAAVFALLRDINAVIDEPEETNADGTTDRNNPDSVTLTFA